MEGASAPLVADGYGVSSRAEIHKLPFFEGLTEAQITRFLGQAEERRFNAGDEVFSEGQRSTDLFLLLEGKLQVAGKGGVLAEIVAPGIFGEMGMLTGRPRAADIVAVGPAVALAISRSAFLSMVDQDKDFGLQIYRNVIAVVSDYVRSNKLLLEFFQMLK